ncbi:MAG: divergent polysaccharide deacetylase family protein [Candidatus Omnitrophica bacterium]|nr:divergent polysaccharide deacetylase family protein [Candidatus Omnitrophota bacterium]
MRRRSKYKNKRKPNNEKRRFLIFFIIGIIIGAIGLIFHNIIHPSKVYKIEKLPPPHFKVAIVLDDFGYNYRNVEAIVNLKRPITFSILPHLPYSKIIARRVYQMGFEAVLHLPLEPRKGERLIRPEINTITVDMKSDEVLNSLYSGIADLPYIKGVSNHQGSKATENAVLMRVIFTELKKRNLFFLDSLVSNKSVCKKVAKEVGIKFARRDVFLDNKEDFEDIKGQMQQLIKRAKKKGMAIGIGHDREKTVIALSRLIPEAEKDGIEFVFLSELVR